MMKVRVKLKRQWTVEPSRERTYYRVEGTYHKVEELDESTGWLIIYYDLIDVMQGTIVYVLEVDINGITKTTKKVATSEGLPFA